VDSKHLRLFRIIIFIIIKFKILQPGDSRLTHELCTDEKPPTCHPSFCIPDALLPHVGQKSRERRLECQLLLDKLRMKWK
jgi:hypothetical protein